MKIVEFWVIMVIGSLLLCMLLAKLENFLKYRKRRVKVSRLPWRRGLPLVDGSAYDPAEYSFASLDFPIGTRLMITNGTLHVVAEVRDYGSKPERCRLMKRVELSARAFHFLTEKNEGEFEMTFHVLEDGLLVDKKLRNFLNKR